MAVECPCAEREQTEQIGEQRREEVVVVVELWEEQCEELEAGEEGGGERGAGRRDAARSAVAQLLREKRANSREKCGKFSG